VTEFHELLAEDILPIDLFLLITNAGDGEICARDDSSNMSRSPATLIFIKMGCDMHSFSGKTQ
jgi:hypothetical protein